MKEALVRFDQPFMPHQQSAERAEPRKRPLDDPAMAVPTQVPTILLTGSFVRRSGGDVRLDTPLVQVRAKRVAVLRSIRAPGESRVDRLRRTGIPLVS